MTQTTIDASRAPAPVRAGDRILNLDILRGLAVLGILAVNAISFVWPIQVYGDPESAPFLMEGANRVGTWVVDVFFHDKFRSLFSMLFGVSIFLIGGDGTEAARGALLRRRLLWLGLFGLIHGLAIWFGDILLHYAYCGFVMLLLRSWPARRLLWVGGGICLLWGVIGAGAALAMALLPPEVAAKMSEGGPDADPAAVLAIVDKVRSGWAPAMLENLKAWGLVQGFSLFLIPVTVPLMMLGLGLFKSGWLGGRGPVWTYLAAIAAAAVNLVALAHYQWLALAPGEDTTGGMAEAAAAFGFVITLGYAALLILLTRFGTRAVTGVLAPVGRMAFTNYLAQSVIMAGLFYLPWGPHLYGRMGPGALWAVVAGMWLLQLVWSPLWLARFEMGPLEWVWRRLTYGRDVALLKRA